MLAAFVAKSGAWLNTLPNSSLGLRMDDNTVRVAVGLCLGVSTVTLILAFIVGKKSVTWELMV